MDNSYDISECIQLAIVAIVFTLVGYLAGSDIQKVKDRQEAVAQGHAYYQADDKGHVSFNWKK